MRPETFGTFLGIGSVAHCLEECSRTTRSWTGYVVPIGEDDGALRRGEATALDNILPMHGFTVRAKLTAMHNRGQDMGQRITQWHPSRRGEPGAGRGAVVVRSLLSDLRRLALLAALAVAWWCIGPSAIAAGNASGLVWGACGHPSSTGPQLWRDPAMQIATLAQRGLKTYRFDVFLTSDHPNAAADVQTLLSFAQASGITLHPVLYVPFTWGDSTDGGRYPSTDEGLEAQGYNRVFPFVLQFAGAIRDWELENELSLRAGFKSGMGRYASDYSTVTARQWAAVLRGMSRAVRDAGVASGAQLRTVVDTVYVDLGLTPYLESQGVFVDKLAYHYYYAAATTPYKIYAPDGSTINLFAELAQLGKPVIINEFNAGEIYAPGHGKPYDDAAALLSLKTHIGYLLSQTTANIEGVEFYELYNEAWKDVVESNFGLMSDAVLPRKQILLAAAYACGQLSTTERATLLDSGLFTIDELNARLSACGQ